MTRSERAEGIKKWADSVEDPTPEEYYLIDPADPPAPVVSACSTCGSTDPKAPVWCSNGFHHKTTTPRSPLGALADRLDRLADYVDFDADPQRAARILRVVDAAPADASDLPAWLHALADAVEALR